MEKLMEQLYGNTMSCRPDWGGVFRALMSEIKDAELDQRRLRYLAAQEFPDVINDGISPSTIELFREKIDKDMRGES